MYDLVWSKPVRLLAEEFGVSDVGLSKQCKKHEVPLPPRGYWARVAAGKSVERAPLPQRGVEIHDTMILGGNRRGRWPSTTDLVDSEIAPAPTFDEPIGDIQIKARKLLGKVTVPRDFTKAHRLITKLLDADNERRIAFLSKSYQSSGDAPFFDAPFERRRLRLMNALMIAAQRAGGNPGFSEKNPPGFYYTIGHETLSVTVDHPKQERGSYYPASKADRPASDIMQVVINISLAEPDFSTQWQDTPERRVEKQIRLWRIAASITVASSVRF